MRQLKRLLFIEMWLVRHFIVLGKRVQQVSKMFLSSRTKTVEKLFFIVSFTGLFMYVILALTSLSYTNEFDYDLDLSEGFTGLRYILMWTENDGADITIDENEIGQRAFLDNDCSEVNCFITIDANYLNSSYTNFDAIVFNFYQKKELLKIPRYRSKHQKYVFYSNVPANDYPICHEIMDNFFNWTWTYKLGSDIVSPFIEVRNKNNSVVAPNLTISWPKYDDTIKVSDRLYTNTKTKAIMWVMKECGYQFKRLSLKRLQEALKVYSLVLDVYGCGHKTCPRGGCVAAIKKDYFFYMVYEPSFSEDYVTDEVIMAYDHGAVPIVVGGADYTRFLPDGSYISFHGMKEETLAYTVAYAILHPLVYRDFFKWKNFYTINKVKPSKSVCKLCELLNSKKFNSYSSYENFRKWWHPKPLPKRCRNRDKKLLRNVSFKATADRM